MLQTRAEGVMDYRSGRSAMVFYACSDAERDAARLRGRPRRARAGPRHLGGRALDPVRAHARARAASWTGCWKASSNVSARRRSATPAQRPPAPPRSNERRGTALIAMRDTRFRTDLSWRRRRHRRRRHAGRAHQAARPAHAASRGDDRPGRLRRPVRAAGALQGAAAGVVHRRRRHQAEAGVPDRPSRHRRHRPGRDERERHDRLRRGAAAVPRLLRVGQAGRRASPSA